MQLITCAYREELETIRDNDIDKVMKAFQVEMKQCYIIPPTLVEKYKEEICFMVEIDFTCMEAVIPRIKFIEPMGYEMSAKLIQGYMQIILHSKIDSTCSRWGTYEEKIRGVKSCEVAKDSQKKVKKVIESILKESGMSREDFEEVKFISKEMKENG